MWTRGRDTARRARPARPEPGLIPIEELVMSSPCGCVLVRVRRTRRRSSRHHGVRHSVQGSHSGTRAAVVHGYETASRSRWVRDSSLAGTPPGMRMPSVVAHDDGIGLGKGWPRRSRPSQKPSVRWPPLDDGRRCLSSTTSARSRVQTGPLTPFTGRFSVAIQPEVESPPGRVKFAPARFGHACLTNEQGAQRDE